MPQRLKVAILFGGRSAEHEVSVSSARHVLRALDRTRFDPILVRIDRRGCWSLEAENLLFEQGSEGTEAEASRAVLALEPGTGAVLVRASHDQHSVGPAARRSDPGEEDYSAGPLFQELDRWDVVFPVLHGPMGEDGTVQGLLELLDLPYVGAGVLGSAVGMDKDVSKRLLREAGLPTVDYVALRACEYERDPMAVLQATEHLGWPLFTKPANLGSSVGVRRASSRAELMQALEHAFQFDRKVLVEQAVSGREIECSVLGNDDPIASVPGEVVVQHRDQFYSYDAKYLDQEGAELVIPARLEPTEERTVRELSVRAFRVLECRGLARVDFFLVPDGRVLINEINTLPGFTSISMYPKLWAATGLGSTELVSRLIELALESKARYRKLRVSRD